MDDEPEYCPDPPADALRWDRIVAWRARLLADVSGRWVESEQGADGVFTMGYAELAEAVEAFVAMLYDEQVVVGFDWPGWMDERGRELVDSRELLADASLEDCRRLLAALVRADRFSEGALLGAFEDGLVDAILARVDVLVA